MSATRGMRLDMRRARPGPDPAEAPAGGALHLMGPSTFRPMPSDDYLTRSTAADANSVTQLA
jgi:hypothetical protein